MTNRILPQIDPNKIDFYRQEYNRLSFALKPSHDQLDAIWESSPLYAEFKRIGDLYSPCIASNYLINKNKDVRDIPLKHWDVSTSILHYKHRFRLASEEVLIDESSLIFVDLAFEVKTKPFLEFYFRNCTLREGNAMSLGYAIAWVRAYESFAQHLNSCARKDAKPSSVYFVANSHKTIVKIGYTTDIVQRFNALQSMSHGKLILLGTIEGGLKDEQLLHQRYSLLRSHGEWFCATKDLLKDIEAMVKKNAMI